MFFDKCKILLRNDLTAHRNKVDVSLLYYAASSYFQKAKATESACGPSDTHNKYSVCLSDTSISGLIPTEIKHGLYGQSPSILLDLVPSFTRYHLPEHQQACSRAQCITGALMKISFRALLKGGRIITSCCLQPQGARDCSGILTHCQMGFTEKNVTSVISNASPGWSNERPMAARQCRHPFISLM